MKRSRALLAAALPLTLLAAALAGCSAGGSGSVDSAIKADASGAACATGGDASNAVKVEGEFGGQVALTSETPLPALTSSQRSVLIDGETTPYAEGVTATVAATLIDGTTGEVIDHIDQTAVPNDSAQASNPTWVYDAVRCGAPGQRVAMVITVAEATGDPSTENANDPIVYVLDFTGAETVCETFAPRDENYPEVELGESGAAPKITIPECMEEPTELEITTLVEGDGAVVADGDTVKVNYHGVLWRNGEEFDSSWSRGAPVELSTDGVIEGFQKALVGQKVGSTVLAVVPSEQGYKDGEVRVFVLEILEVVPGA